ncbi:hypothetical protein [Streptomyces sp. NPDC088733]|uniref:hypothetical protein n=1 Tax=Streptomyces sp. NPDC088733 TaxID=3365880 RepID=UPI0038246BAB
MAVLAGAVALAAFTAPAAQAAATGVTVSKAVVNGGKPIVVGTSQVVTPSTSYHFTLPAGYSTAHPERYAVVLFLYHGTTADKGAKAGGIYSNFEDCLEDGTRAWNCKGELYIEPRYRLDSDNDATTWKIGASIRLFKSNGTLAAQEYRTVAGSVQVKRQAKATVNAAPEPVKKGGTITVTGSLVRADWVKHSTTGYVAQPVRLQFLKKGATAYTTVKTVKTGTKGALKTTVKASVDGSWRWYFGGTPTTGATASAADYVDVR